MVELQYAPRINYTGVQIFFATSIARACVRPSVEHQRLQATCNSNKNSSRCNNSNRRRNSSASPTGRRWRCRRVRRATLRVGTAPYRPMRTPRPSTPRLRRARPPCDCRRRRRRRRNTRRAGASGSSSCRGAWMPLPPLATRHRRHQEPPHPQLRQPDNCSTRSNSISRSRILHLPRRRHHQLLLRHHLCHQRRRRSS